MQPDFRATLLPALAALVGALIGGLSTYAVSTQSQNRIDKRNATADAALARGTARVLQAHYDDVVVVVDVMLDRGRYFLAPPLTDGLTYEDKSSGDRRNLLATRLAVLEARTALDTFSDEEHETPHGSSTENIGLWLIGFGALLLIIEALWSTPDKTKGLTYHHKRTTPRERAFYATKITGLVFAGAGSLMVAGSQALAWWVFVATLGAAAVAYILVMAWLLKRAWDEQLTNLRKVLEAGGDADPELAQREAEIARHATWRWCLLHPWSQQVIEDSR